MRRLSVAVAGLLLIAACDSGSATGLTRRPEHQAQQHRAPRQAATSTDAAAWPTYHGTNDRAGLASAPPLHLPLHHDWTRSLDGAVYAEPIVAAGHLIVATENDSVYALRLRSGHVLWRRHLGAPVPHSQLPCGNIDPLGITGTPAYDARTGSVFVVAETTGAHHTLYALNASTGHVRWHHGLDVVNRTRAAQQQRAALLVAHRRVYVAFGGLFGDCGDYVGYLTTMHTDGSGRVRKYAVPTQREAGMWAAGGPVEGPGGDIYVAAGNGAATSPPYDGSDSVTRLTPLLQKVSLFAPSIWAQDNAHDVDLGSSNPMPVNDKIVMAGKRGTAYLLAPKLGGIGGQVASRSGCSAYGGGARSGHVLVLPCNDGDRALHVGTSGMHWLWSQPATAGSPTIAGGTVYSLDPDSGDLLLLSLSSGHVRTRIHVGDLSRFATPTPVGGRVFVGTLSGVVAVRGS